MFTLFCALTVVACLFYYHIVKPMKYWKDRGVGQGNPKWFFGHFWEYFIGKKSGTEILHKIYEQNPNVRYTGMYRFSTPVFIVKDLELIKQITIKDFEYFTDHVDRVPADSDPLWVKNLFNLKGSKWRDMRARLSPAFTSSKMRSIFTLMTQCAENLVQHLLENNNQEVVTVEIRDIFSRYTNDVIATTAFGVKVDSLAYRNNEFYRMGNEVADFSSLRKTIKGVAFWLIPAIKHFIKIQMISDEVGAYFRGIIDDAIKTREEKGIIRPDMLHLLLQARKNVQVQEDKNNVAAVEKGHELVKENISKVSPDLSNEDITAHALIFFIAGFESVSSFISFAAYELAVNPGMQGKLQREVCATLDECDGKLTYEALSKMKYMDMVLSETQRKWPHFPGIERTCTKQYTIKPVTPGEKPVQIEKGTEIRLPMYSIHRDPKYFPEPERFDPERFNDENKGNIQPFTYFPFGLGPRNCIGSRFTLLEAKIVLSYIISRFQIVPVEKTLIPLKLSTRGIFDLKPPDGLQIGFKLYNK